MQTRRTGAVHEFISFLPYHFPNDVLLISRKSLKKKQTFPTFSLLSAGSMASLAAGAARFMYILVISGQVNYSLKFQ